MDSIIIAIVVCSLIYLYMNPDSIRIITNMITPPPETPMRAPLTKQNLLPPLLGTPIGDEMFDYKFAPGWVGFGWAVRSKPTNFSGVKNPSDSPYYFVAESDGVISASLTNLLVSQMYEVNGYVLKLDDAHDSHLCVKLDDVIVLPNFAAQEINKFVVFGPVAVRATATSHTIHFYCVGSNAYRSIVLTGLSFK